MPVTGFDIVDQGLKKAGILGQGKAASAVDSVDALADLNDMLAQWQTQRWMIWDLVQLSKTSTGAQSYTVGPAGDFPTIPRPGRIESAFLRQNISGGLPVDTPLRPMPSREDYNRLALKTMVSFPYSYFYDSAFPLGIIHTYPVMTANIYALHISVRNVLPVIELETDLSSLPGEYIAAMKFNLARRLRQGYGKGKTPDVELNAFANSSLDVIKQGNLQVPELVIPVGVVRPARYNILSDQANY